LIGDFYFEHFFGFGLLRLHSVSLATPRDTALIDSFFLLIFSTITSTSHSTGSEFSNELTAQANVLKKGYLLPSDSLSSDYAIFLSFFIMALYS